MAKSGWKDCTHEAAITSAKSWQASPYLRQRRDAPGLLCFPKTKGSKTTSVAAFGSTLHLCVLTLGGRWGRRKPTKEAIFASQVRPREVPAPLNIFLGSKERKQLSQDLANCRQSQTPESSLTRFSLVHASKCPCLLESQLSSEFETWLWSNNFETLYVKIDSPVGIKTTICFLSSTFQWRRDEGGRVERSTKVCVGCLAPHPHSLHTYGLLPAFYPLFQPPGRCFFTVRD